MWLYGWVTLPLEMRQVFEKIMDWFVLIGLGWRDVSQGTVAVLEPRRSLSPTLHADEAGQLGFHTYITVFAEWTPKRGHVGWRVERVFGLIVKRANVFLYIQLRGKRISRHDPSVSRCCIEQKIYKFSGAASGNFGG